MCISKPILDCWLRSNAHNHCCCKLMNIAFLSFLQDTSNNPQYVAFKICLLSLLQWFLSLRQRSVKQMSLLWLSIPTRPFSVHWLFVSHKDACLIRIENFTHLWLQRQALRKQDVHLQIVVGSPLECVSCPAMCSRLGLEIIDHIYEFPPVEWTYSLKKKCLVTRILSTSLLYHAYLCRSQVSKTINNIPPQQAT